MPFFLKFYNSLRIDNNKKKKKHNTPFCAIFLTFSAWNQIESTQLSDTGRKKSRKGKTGTFQWKHHLKRQGIYPHKTKTGFLEICPVDKQGAHKNRELLLCLSCWSLLCAHSTQTYSLRAT